MAEERFAREDRVGRLCYHIFADASVYCLCSPLGLLGVCGRRKKFQLIFNLTLDNLKT